MSSKSPTPENRRPRAKPAAPTPTDTIAAPTPTAAELADENARLRALNEALQERLSKLQSEIITRNSYQPTQLVHHQAFLFVKQLFTHRTRLQHLSVQRRPDLNIDGEFGFEAILTLTHGTSTSTFSTITADPARALYTALGRFEQEINTQRRDVFGLDDVCNLLADRPLARHRYAVGMAPQVGLDNVAMAWPPADGLTPIQKP